MFFKSQTVTLKIREVRIGSRERGQMLVGGKVTSRAIKGDAKSSASLYTGATLNLGDGVLGEVEKDSFIALPGKAEHSKLLPRETMCPNPGGFDEEFYSNS